MKNKLLQLVWSAFPWLIVLAIAFFIVQLGGRINAEKMRLDQEKAAAVKTRTPPMNVIVLPLKPQRLEDKISLPGQVEPYEDLWVKAEVGGQVQALLVREGQVVRAGDPMIQLDDRDYRIRLDRIEASYRLTKLEYERIAVLDRKKITSASRFDEIEAKLKDITAQRAAARLALERTRIRAPITGQLNEVTVNKGDLLEKGAPVAQILQVSAVKVAVGVPESDVTSFFDLKTADVVIEALNGRRVTGEKIFLSKQPRSLARLFDLELKLPNPDLKILPGMFARVELVKNIYPEALVVPVYAVINQGGESFVYVEEDGAARKRPVRTGMLMGWQIHVLEGLNVGDRLIIVGHRLLNDRQTVKVVKTVDSAQEALTS